MRLYYLDQAHAEALQAQGFKLDNTDNFDDFKLVLDKVMGYSEANVIMERSSMIMSLPTIKKMGFSSSSRRDSFNYDKFNLFFPELVGCGPYGFTQLLDVSDVIANRDGDVIVCNNGTVTTECFEDRALAALSSQMSMADLLKTPLWTFIKEGC